MLVVEHPYNQPPERLRAWPVRTYRTGDADEVLKGEWERLTDWIRAQGGNAVCIVRDDTGRWTAER